MNRTESTPNVEQGSRALAAEHGVRHGVSPQRGSPRCDSGPACKRHSSTRGCGLACLAVLRLPAVAIVWCASSRVGWACASPCRAWASAAWRRCCRPSSTRARPSRAPAARTPSATPTCAPRCAAVRCGQCRCLPIPGGPPPHLPSLQAAPRTRHAAWRDHALAPCPSGPRTPPPSVPCSCLLCLVSSYP